MNSDWLYIAIKQRFLECHKATHEGTITLEEVDLTFTALAGELLELYSHKDVEHAMSEFSNDLRLVTLMERIDKLGWLAVVLGYLACFFISEKRVDRVTQLNDEILMLEASYSKPD